MDNAIRLRPLDDADSIAAVIHWRIGVLTDDSAPVRMRGPLASLPPTDGPAIEVARHAGELMRQRWRELRAALAETTQALPWEALGPRPTEPDEASAWLTAATAVTAYRERFAIPDYTPMVGPRPPHSRPDAQAAWDYARLQADGYLARRLRHLDDGELNDLDARQQSIIDRKPCLIRNELVKARRQPDAVAGPRADVTSARRRVRQLERDRDKYVYWQRLAARAADIRRQIALEPSRRARSRAVSRHRRPVPRR